MPDSPLKDVSSAIPEFYFDLIARVIPGALAIHVYCWEQMVPLQSFAEISIGLLACYLLGLLIDITSDIVLGRWVFDLAYVIGRRLGAFHFLNDRELWVQLRRLNQSRQLVFNKMMAEKAMLRNVAFVNIIAIFFPPTVLSHEHWAVRVLPLIVVLFCHFTMQGYVAGRLQSESNAAMAEPLKQSDQISAEGDGGFDSSCAIHGLVPFELLISCDNSIWHFRTVNHE